MFLEGTMDSIIIIIIIIIIIKTWWYVKKPLGSESLNIYTKVYL